MDMKFIKFLFKKFRGFVVVVIIAALMFGGYVYTQLSSGYGTVGAICFGAFLAAAIMAGCFLTPYHIYKVEKILDEKGYCDELIKAYNLVYKKKGANEHLILALFYLIMNRLEQVQQELDLAQGCGISQLNDKVRYVDILMSLKISNKRFDEAQAIYDENKQLIDVYCDSYKDSICMRLYSKGSVLSALKGNYDDAMTAIGKMDAVIENDKRFVFSKYNALLQVYLIKGDLQKADDIKQRTLSELETFGGFDYKSDKALIHGNIGLSVSLYDPRVQTRQSEGN